MQRRTWARLRWLGWPSVWSRRYFWSRFGPRPDRSPRAHLGGHRRGSWVNEIVPGASGHDRFAGEAIR